MSLVLLLEYVSEVVDVVHGVVDDVHLAQLLPSVSVWEMLSEDVKAAVDALYAVSLARVPFYCLDVLLGFDFIAVNRVHNHQLSARRHFYGGVVNNERGSLL